MRRRLTVLAVLASSLAVLLFALPLAVAVARYLASDERGELQRIAATAAVSLRGDITPTALSRNPALRGEQILSVYDASGTRLFGAGPATGGPLVLAALSGRAGTSSTGDRLTAAAAITDGDTVIAAVTASTPASDLRHRIGLAWAEMTGTGVLAVLVTALAARRYSRRLSRPLEQLAATARQIGEGQRNARTPGSSIPEIHSVGRALNDSADQLHAAQDRERRFTSDASHQLRTPLAGLRLELETALLNADADPRPAMTRALTAADHLQDTIETLLTLARDHPHSTADLRDALDRLRDRWTGPLAAENRPLRINVEPNTAVRVRCAAGGLDQILDVLLDNATRHGQGAVTVTVRSLAGAAAVDVSNPTPPIGTPEDQLFQRRNTQAHGHGIGLSLARSLAEADGGRLVLADAATPTFALLLPLDLRPDDRSDTVATQR